MAHFRMGLAVNRLAIKNQPAAKSSADGDIGKGGEATTGAQSCFSKTCAIDVRVQPHRNA